MINIKQLARSFNLKINEIIALAPNNDPFYSCVTPATKRDAEWFRFWFTKLGFEGVKGIHLRRIHYKLISQPSPVFMPSREPYQNTENCWKYLVMSAKQARYGKMVSLESFDDRRNPDPVIHRQIEEMEDEFIEKFSGSASIKMPDFPIVPTLDYSINTTARQRYHLEIWCEKSTMNDVLLPLCRRYKANLVTGLGEMSITQCSRLVDRLSSMPCRIFYISDFDPAGKSMPVAVARKIEWLIRDRGINADLKIFQIALTQSQVEELRLPRTPIKETELRRDKFESRYGADAVELDAIEALHPGRLSSIVSQHLERYYDRSLEPKLLRRESEILKYMAEIEKEIYDRHNLDDLKEKFDALVQEFRDRLEPLRTEIMESYESISQDFEERTSDLDIADRWPLPAPKECTNEPIALFDSSRDYLDQLQFYKAFQEGNECLDIEIMARPLQGDLFAA